MLNGNGGLCITPGTCKQKGFLLMKKMDGTRVKRILTALLLVVVMSFSVAFADDGTQGETAGGNGSTQTAQTTDGQSGQTAPAVSAAAPAPQVSHIIKKGKNYYYKNANGKIRKKAGFVKDLGKLYYVTKGGKIKRSKSFKVRKKYYRANSKGVILTGIYKWKGKYNYSSASGKWKKSAGFVKWNGNTYYVQKGGAVVIDDAFSVNNVPYDADKSGVVRKLEIPDGDGEPVTAVAKSQVGVKTGKKYWKWYYRTKFRDADRTPWCGAFVAWCYNAAGEYDRVSVAKKFGPLGYVPSYSRYANTNDKWVKKSEAKGGDIIIFGSNMHVGLVEGISGNCIVTIEGNTGPTAVFRKPGAVLRKVYRIDKKTIKGVIRP